MITPSEYIQLKAFARQDGALLALLWTASFACYVIGLNSPGIGLVAAVLALVTPFFVSRRLRKFRDDCLDGVVSFRRGWAFAVLTFFYGSLLFAVVQFVYFAYLDHGSFLSGLTQMFAAPENAGIMKTAAWAMPSARRCARCRPCAPSTCRSIS